MPLLFIFLSICRQLARRRCHYGFILRLLFPAIIAFTPLIFNFIFAFIFSFLPFSPSHYFTFFIISPRFLLFSIEYVSRHIDYFVDFFDFIFDFLHYSFSGFCHFSHFICEASLASLYYWFPLPHIDIPASPSFLRLIHFLLFFIFAYFHSSFFLLQIYFFGLFLLLFSLLIARCMLSLLSSSSFFIFLSDISFSFTHYATPFSLSPLFSSSIFAGAMPLMPAPIPLRHISAFIIIFTPGSSLWLPFRRHIDTPLRHSRFHAAISAAAIFSPPNLLLSSCQSFLRFQIHAHMPFLSCFCDSFFESLFLQHIFWCFRRTFFSRFFSASLLLLSPIFHYRVAIISHFSYFFLSVFIDFLRFFSFLRLYDCFCLIFSPIFDQAEITVSCILSEAFFCLSR